MGTLISCRPETRLASTDRLDEISRDGDAQVPALEFPVCGAPFSTSHRLLTTSDTFVEGVDIPPLPPKISKLDMRQPTARLREHRMINSRRPPSTS